jgi:hypothetical protein
MKIPVITLWQPWGNWVDLGWKTIETRTHPRFAKLEGQTIGIHLGLKWDKDAIQLARRFLTAEQLFRTKEFLKIGGAIVATAFVKEHRLLNTKDSPFALIDCGHTTRWGLILENIKQIEAIPTKGRQGIWYYNLPIEESQ